MPQDTKVDSASDVKKVGSGGQDGATQTMDPMQDPNVQTILQIMGQGLMEAMNDPNLGSPIAESGQPKDFENFLAKEQSRPKPFQGVDMLNLGSSSIFKDEDPIKAFAQNAIKYVTPDEKEAKTAKEGVLGDNLDTANKILDAIREPSDMVDEFNRRYPEENRGALLTSNIGTAMTLLGALLGAPGLAAGGMALTGAGERRIKDWTRQWNIQAKNQGEDAVQDMASGRALSDFKTRFSRRLGVSLGKGVELSDKEINALVEEELAGYTNMNDADREAARRWAETAEPDYTAAKSAMDVGGYLTGGEQSKDDAKREMRRMMVSAGEPFMMKTSAAQLEWLQDTRAANKEKFYMVEDTDLSELLVDFKNRPIPTSETDEMLDTEKDKAYTIGQKFFMDKMKFKDKEHVSGDWTISKEHTWENALMAKVPVGKTTIGRLSRLLVEALEDEIKSVPIGKKQYRGMAALEFDTEKGQAAVDRARKAATTRGGLGPLDRTTVAQRERKPPIRVFKDDFPFPLTKENIRLRLEEAFEDPERYFSKEFNDWITLEAIRLGF